MYIQDGFNDKVAEMSNLRWLRLKKTQMKSLPEEIDRFSKLVSRLQSNIEFLVVTGRVYTVL